MKNDATKFAWAYLLTHGKETTGEWLYYGSRWESSEYTASKDTMTRINEEVLESGIDWGKTKEPEVRDEYCFEGTDEGSSNCLATVGHLYLKNGKHYLIGSEDDDAAYLAGAARELLRGRSGLEQLAARL